MSRGSLTLLDRSSNYFKDIGTTIFLQMKESFWTKSGNSVIVQDTFFKIVLSPDASTKSNLLTLSIMTIHISLILIIPTICARYIFLENFTRGFDENVTGSTFQKETIVYKPCCTSKDILKLTFIFWGGLTMIVVIWIKLLDFRNVYKHNGVI